MEVKEMEPRKYYNCFGMEQPKEKYRIVVMETNGRVTIGRAYDTFEEVHNAMIELRMIYAKNEVAHHVGYVKE
jgi:hypothetical protein